MASKFEDANITHVEAELMAVQCSHVGKLVSGIDNGKPLVYNDKNCGSLAAYDQAAALCDASFGLCSRDCKSAGTNVHFIPD